MIMKPEDFPPGSKVVVDEARHVLYAEDAGGNVIYPPTGDLAGLKAEVARLHAAYPMKRFQAGCDPNTAFACALLYPLFLAAERAGWLPAECPAEART